MPRTDWVYLLLVNPFLLLDVLVAPTFHSQKRTVVNLPCTHVCEHFCRIGVPMQTPGLYSHFLAYTCGVCLQVETCLSSSCCGHWFSSGFSQETCRVPASILAYLFHLFSLRNSILPSCLQPFQPWAPAPVLPPTESLPRPLQYTVTSPSSQLQRDVFYLQLSCWTTRIYGFLLFMLFCMCLSCGFNR